MTLIELRDKANQALEFGADPDMPVIVYDEARNSDLDVTGAEVNEDDPGTAFTLTLDG